jgi:hypothetical protein
MESGEQDKVEPLVSCVEGVGENGFQKGGVIESGTVYYLAFSFGTGKT